MTNRNRMRSVGLALAMLLAAGVSNMASAAISVTANAVSGWPTVNNPTLAFTFTPGANGLLVVMVGGEANVTGMTSVQWDDGAARPYLTVVTNNTATAGWSFMYSLTNPAVGSGTIKVILNNTPTRCYVGALYATGVGALESKASSAASAATITTGPIAASAGALVIDNATSTASQYNTGGGIVGGDTQLFIMPAANSGGAASYKIVTTNGSYSASWTDSGADNSSILLASFAAASTASPNLPVVNNASGATNVQANSAWLNGMLTSTGASDTAVFAMWGTSDAGTNWGSWAFTNSWAAPQTTNDMFTVNAGSLDSGASYYYRFAATNAAGVAWAPSATNFITDYLTVKATDPVGRTTPSDPVKFTVYRPAGCSNGALIVNYTLSGTASSPADYSIDKASGSLVLASGQTNGDITVTPVYKIDTEKNVILTLTAGPYLVGSDSVATGTLSALTGLTYTWNAGSGGTAWMTAANPPWTPTPGASDFSNSVNAFLLGTANDLATANGGTFIAPLTVANNAILQLSASSTASNLVLNGGKVQPQNKTDYTLSGKVSITADNSTIANPQGSGLQGGCTFTVGASLVGTNSLQAPVTGYGASYLTFQGDASGFSGGVSVTGIGVVVANANQALGSGNITIQSNAILKLNAFTQTNTINVSPGATLQIGGAVVASNVYLNGGELANVSDPGSVTGKVNVTARSTIAERAGGTYPRAFTVNASLLGTTPIVAYASSQSTLTFQGDASGFSGDVRIDGAGAPGKVVANVNQAFGPGIITVTNNGQLQVNAIMTNTINVLGGGGLLIGTQYFTNNNLSLGGTTGRGTVSRAAGGDVILAGNILVNVGGGLIAWAPNNYTSYAVDLRAVLGGSGPLELNTALSGNAQQKSKITVSTNNSAFSGAITVSGDGNGVYVTHTNALGSGPVLVATNTLYLANAGTAVDWVLPNNLSGKGSIKVEAGANKVTCAGGTVNPGTNGVAVTNTTTGILTVWGGLAFGAGSTLQIDIAGTNGVAGVDFDRLVVSNNMTSLNNAVLVVNLNTNLGNFALNGQDLIVATNAASLATQFASVIFTNGVTNATRNCAVVYNQPAGTVKVKFTAPATQLAITTQPVGDVTGTPLAPQPVIEIRDVSNVKVAGDNSTTVTVSIVEGVGGTLGGTTQVVANAGVATFSGVTLAGTVGENYKLLFTASPVLTPATSIVVNVTAAGGSPTQLAITTQPKGGASGATLLTQPAIEIRDVLNAKVIADSSTEVTVSIAEGAGGTLGGSLTVTANVGVATFAGLTLTGTPGENYKLKFEASGLTSATSGVVTVWAPAAQLAITTQPVGGVSGKVLPTQPVIEIRDAGNVIVTNDSSTKVTVSIAEGAGGTLGGTIQVTANLGVATFSNVTLRGPPTENYKLAFVADPVLTPATSIVVNVTAQSFTWNAGSAGTGWMTPSNPPWGSTAPIPDDFSATYNTFLLGTSGDSATATGGTFAAALTIGSNATLQVTVNSTAGNMTLGTTSGRANLYFPYAGNGKTISGTITLAAGGGFIQGDSAKYDTPAYHIGAQLGGTGPLRVKAVKRGDSWCYNNIYLEGNSTNYSGVVTISRDGPAGGGTVVAQANNALGTGTTLVESNGLLQLNTYVQTNRINVLGWGGLVIDGNATANTLFLGETTGQATISRSGTATGGLAGNAFVNPGGVLVAWGANLWGNDGIMTLSSVLSGTGPATFYTDFIPSYSTASKIILTANNSAFSGPVNVTGAGFGLFATHTNALGTGPVTVATPSSPLVLQKAGGAVDWILPNNLNGGGTIQVEAGANKLTCVGGTVNPGTNGVAVTTNTTGVLTIAGKLDFGAGSTLQIDIASTNNVAGVDFDRLAVTGILTNLNNAVLRVNVTPSLNLGALIGQEFIVATNAASLASQFASVTYSGGWSARVVYNDPVGTVKLTNVSGPSGTTIIVY